MGNRRRGGSPQPAEPLGFVWGPVNAEDLCPVGTTNWVVTSGMTGVTAPEGRLYAIDVADHSCNEVFPYLSTFDPDADRFGAPEPLDPHRFEPHGIDVRVLDDGRAELYVVNHGWRESVEVFEIVLGDRRPTLCWLGAAVLPAGAMGNDVAATGEGGFVVSVNLVDPAGAAADLLAADTTETGGAFAWSPGSGWRMVPGSGIDSANGVAVSADGAAVYLAGWASRCIRKVPRGAGDGPMVAATDILTDNLTWTADGALLAAGAFDTEPDDFIAGHFGPEPRLRLPSRVIRVDADSLAVQTLLEYRPPTFGVATTAIEMGDEIWVGAARDHGIARFATPTPPPAADPPG